MCAFDIRLLGPGDERRLEAFFGRMPDLTLFQRSNLRQAGAVDDGRRYSGTYAAAIANEEVIGVVAHYWNGFVMPLAPLPVTASSMPRCIALASRVKSCSTTRLCSKLATAR